MWRNVTVKPGKRLDAFDQWCIRHILQVPFTAHVINQVVRTRSAQPPVTQTITARRLRFFGHIVRSDSDEDHKRALNAAEGLETSYNRERPETTEPGSVICPAQSIWSWTVAWNLGNSNAPAGSCYMKSTCTHTLAVMGYSRKTAVYHSVNGDRALFHNANIIILKFNVFSQFYLLCLSSL